MKSSHMTCQDNEIILTPIMMKTMNKKTENEEETGIIQVFMGIKPQDGELRLCNVGYAR